MFDPSDSTPTNVIERRKAEHMRLAANSDVAGQQGPGWSDIHLLHDALPKCDLARIDLAVDFLGRQLQAPLLIAGMTGGHEAAREVNKLLARAAEYFGIAMGVGSQRAALIQPDLADTYAIARQQAPNAFLIANLGAAQLVDQDSTPRLTGTDLQRAVDMIQADALAIHLNFLEELIQTEGDRRVAGLGDALTDAIRSLTVPALAKETGVGISRETAVELARVGFSGLDVGGYGGTSFAAVEALRAQSAGDDRGVRMGEVFAHWGLPTPVAVVAVSTSSLPIVATGGVRSGLDAAKAIALGGTLVGVARPLLLAALAGEDSLFAWIRQFLEELRAAVFLTGGARISDLRLVKRVILGDTRTWLQDLGYLDAAEVAAAG